MLPRRPAARPVLQPGAARCRAVALAGQRAGATALEFAFVGPVLVALLMLMMEMSWQLLGNAALQFGAYEAARFASTGSTTPADVPAGTSGLPSDRAGVIRFLVGYYSGNLVPSSVTITATTYGCYANSVSGTGGTSGYGTGGSTVVYKLSFTQPFIFGGFAKALTGLSGLTHVANIVVQDEQFSSTSSTC